MKRLLILPVILFALGFNSSCARYAALKSGEYNSVKPSTLVSAGKSDDATLADDVAKLLQQRLSNPDQSINAEQAIEGVIALKKIGNQSHAQILLQLLKSDPDADVRYFCVEAAWQLDPQKFKKEANALAKQEKSKLVQKQINLFLAK